MRRLHIIVFAALVVGAPGIVRADEATAFYTPIKTAAAAQNWTVVLQQLEQVQIAWIDYRFFYHRARAFYALGNLRAGDSDAAICRLWDKTLSAEDQANIAHDLDTAKSYATQLARGHVRTGVDISGLRANHVDHDE